MDYSQYPINPNWFHLHIAYHGSASSVVISGTDIVRPRGQAPPAEKSSPYFGRSRKLDFELEMLSQEMISEHPLMSIMHLITYLDLF
ncbi:fumarylacetoacetase-like isoform X2 [Silene latifolia]|uniref:fumarylacetoacetase-like isoform X2 n=1 Tax=Silene latifolia TaxID=37657 RepID=UPI003D76EFE4